MRHASRHDPEDAVLLHYALDKDARGYILTGLFAHYCETPYGNVGSTWDEDIARLQKTLPESLRQAERIAGTKVLVPPPWQLENRYKVRPLFRKGMHKMQDKSGDAPKPTRATGLPGMPGTQWPRPTAGDLR